jgi:hypothetical protein
VKQATRLNELAGPTLDMSDDARRERCYSWYTRMAMPSREDMKTRLKDMPSSTTGVTPDDVDLLPWNDKGSIVNVGKMQRFINAGFKSKFTSRRGKKPDVVVVTNVADSDSDSD